MSTVGNKLNGAPGTAYSEFISDMWRYFAESVNSI